MNQAYYISLFHRSDRRSITLPVIKELFPDVFLYHGFSSVNPDDRRAQDTGCNKSHKSVLTDAVLRGVDVAFIFEDDAYYVGNWDIREVPKLLPDDWDLCYFYKTGTFPVNEEPFPKLRRATFAHAYAVKVSDKIRDGIDVLGDPIDLQYSELIESGQLNAYGMVEDQFVQIDGFSDIRNKYRSLFRTGEKHGVRM